jgi:lysine 2,3-aminomutase
MIELRKYNPDYLAAKLPEIFELAGHSESLDDFRNSLSVLTHKMAAETFDDYALFAEGSIIRVRDCARILFRIFTRRSEHLADFSVAEALRDLALGKSRPDLGPAFYADMLHLFQGLTGRGPGSALVDIHLKPTKLAGRQAAVRRSEQLDTLYEAVTARLNRYTVGLDRESIERRRRRRERILTARGADLEDWLSWEWQTDNIFRETEEIAAAVDLSDQEKQAIEVAKRGRLPFGVTPYYLSLMDDGDDRRRDRSIRAQVLPPPSYVTEMTGLDDRQRAACDFMMESDTSPIRLITRRYPAICIFKPFNTCPQICVYCQRNWEIQDAMEPGALARDADIDAALDWINKHQSISEVLVTGGDPLAMPDDVLARILDGVASISHVERIRVGSRVLVTMPMRITDRLADLLASYQEPGGREIAIVTHVQHSYELTQDTVDAVQKLRMRGMKVYNQLVYTFFISRRFEAAFLRQQLCRVGIEPYYTFNTKGKDETIEYRVPLARLLQEQKEEARLLPGLTRTDEAVYNVPGLGKNYLRARQHRDLISVLPNGARLYEFHPWEKNIAGDLSTYVHEDVAILDYLQRLDAIGEDVADYDTIWYYF